MRRATMLLVPALLLAAGCNEDPIEIVAGSGGGTGQGFNVIVVDDPTLTPGGGGSVIDGTLEGAVRIGLRNQLGTLVDLGAPESFDLDLQDPDAGQVVVSGFRAPTGTYVGAEVRLENASALIRQGSTIGSTVLTADGALDLGSGGIVVVDRALTPFTITDDTDTILLVDLNAETWVTLDNLDDGFVDEQDLIDAITVDLD